MDPDYDEEDGVSYESSASVPTFIRERRCMSVRRSEAIHELGGETRGYRLRRQLARAVQAQDRLYPLVVRLRPRRHLLVQVDTDLVIEGAPRSANTFLVAACDLLNPGLKLAHHLHTTSQVKRAAHWDVPCVVLVRPPLDAAVSVLVWAPDRRPGEVLSDWIRFYRRSLPFSDRFLPVGFERVTDDPGSVFAQLNRRFGLSLNSDYVAEVHREDILADVEARARSFDGAVYETRVARPSDSALRQQQKEIARSALDAPAHAALRAEADELHRRYRELIEVAENDFLAESR